MKPRASRTAVMVASVPVETIRSALDGGDAVLDDRGQVGLGRRGGAEGQAAVHGGVHRLEHGRVGVAQQCRPPGADQVDVLAAVGVGQVGALGRRP